MSRYDNVNAAPMKNVAAFATLLQKMAERDPDMPGLACFFGPSGWGKSKSAVYGANRYRAAYIECGQFTTARSLLADVLRELNVQKARGTVEDMKRLAIEIMAAEPSRPLIVDEAHFVAKKAFVDVLRELSDKSGAPVILIGEEMLPQNLELFERVHNRVLEWLPALPCDAEDFAHLAAHRCRGIKIAADLAAAILERTRGNTRRIVVNLSRIAETAKLTGKSIIDLETFGGASAIAVNPKITPRHYK
ncbi:MAG: ATP-binding protein [Rhizobiaceae bacterium]|nr:ATP-binding protein [Rhizobiaceae bacterium]